MCLCTLKCSNCCYFCQRDDKLEDVHSPGCSTATSQVVDEKIKESGHIVSFTSSAPPSNSYVEAYPVNDTTLDFDKKR